uniref:PilT protein n=1 Tax=Rhodopseudomonas palustris (strain BisA53) TaxID=316055 RepID=Q07LL5_RHOP5
MRGIDTNLIVRYLTGDHPKQSAKARAVIDGEDVFVATTVLLETEWVLRSVYGFSPSQIGTALRAFAGLARVSLENPALIATALDRVTAGMDFADALHIGSSERCDGFATFDQRLIRRANAAGVSGVGVP